MIYRFKIKSFNKKQIYEAYEHSMNGGVALHVYRGMQGLFPDAPDCFIRSSEWGHLLCQNQTALKAIAFYLGVNKIVVHRIGKKRQHVDLCLSPLRKAIETANSGNIIELIPKNEIASKNKKILELINDRL